MEGGGQVGLKFRHVKLGWVMEDRRRHIEGAWLLGVHGVDYVSDVFCSIAQGGEISADCPGPVGAVRLGVERCRGGLEWEGVQGELV